MLKFFIGFTLLAIAAIVAYMIFKLWKDIKGKDEENETLTGAEEYNKILSFLNTIPEEEGIRFAKKLIKILPALLEKVFLQKRLTSWEEMLEAAQEVLPNEHPEMIKLIVETMINRPGDFSEALIMLELNLAEKINSLQDYSSEIDRSRFF
jgi:hypothetical protein